MLCLEIRFLSSLARIWPSGRLTVNFCPIQFSGRVVLLEVSFVVRAINSHVVGSLVRIFTYQRSIFLFVLYLDLFRHIGLSTLVPLYIVPRKKANSNEVDIGSGLVK